MLACNAKTVAVQLLFPLSTHPGKREDKKEQRKKGSGWPHNNPTIKTLSHHCFFFASHNNLKRPAATRPSFIWTI